MAKPECIKKIALLAEVQKAMATLMAIHNDEMDALLKEDFKGVDKLRRKLAAARDDKATKLDTYRDHVMKHGC